MRTTRLLRLFTGNEKIGFRLIVHQVHHLGGYRAALYLSRRGGATAMAAAADARVFGLGRKSEPPETAETRRLRDGFRATESPETPARRRSAAGDLW